MRSREDSRAPRGCPISSSALGAARCFSRPADCHAPRGGHERDSHSRDERKSTAVEAAPDSSQAGWRPFRAHGETVCADNPAASRPFIFAVAATPFTPRRAAVTIGLAQAVRRLCNSNPRIREICIRSCRRVPVHERRARQGRGDVMAGGDGWRGHTRSKRELRGLDS